MSIIPPFKYRDNIPKVQLFEDLGSLTGIPFAQPEDIKGLDKPLNATGSIVKAYKKFGFLNMKKLIQDKKIKIDPSIPFSTEWVPC